MYLIGCVTSLLGSLCVCWSEVRGLSYLVVPFIYFFFLTAAAGVVSPAYSPNLVLNVCCIPWKCFE